MSIYSYQYSVPSTPQEWLSIPAAISDDETGFDGGLDYTYRSQGWAFVLGGGSVYDNLDYSFTIYHPNGTDTPDDPGGGSPALRVSLGALQALLGSLPLRECAPMPSIPDASSNPPQPGLQAQTLGQVCASGGILATYIYGGNVSIAPNATLEVVLSLPGLDSATRSSDWTVTWADPVTGTCAAPINVSADSSGKLNLPPSPWRFNEDVVVVAARSDTPWTPPIQ